MIAGLHVARLEWETDDPVGLDRAAQHLERAHAAQQANRWEHPID